uniref:Ribosomal protein L34 n=1 Tax=Wrangelia sp. TaxID=2575620 RepID=A0A4D6X1C7_9FLOR|nr:ribosomal protein L34 [Wrangelia sp.]
MDKGSNLKKKRRSGFRKRMQTKSGKNILNNKRRKKRRIISL